MWSLGITVYTGIYARIGTGPLAAVSIASTIEGVAIVPFIAMANAAAIMLGNRIGADKITDAMDYARRFIFLSVGGGVVMGLVILITRGALMSLYRISPEARIDALGGVGGHCDHALAKGRQPGDDRRGHAQRRRHALRLPGRHRTDVVARHPDRSAECVCPGIACLLGCVAGFVGGRRDEVFRFAVARALGVVDSQRDCLFARLDQPIDYKSHDNEPVDLIFLCSPPITRAAIT